MGFIVAVDGPAGSGKGSITQIVAERLNLVTIDTGAMYRSVTLAMLEQNVGIDDLDKIVEILKNIKIEYNLEKIKAHISHSAVHALRHSFSRIPFIMRISRAVY